MIFNTIGYLCPFCGKYHVPSEPEFIAHWPTPKEQEILMGDSNGV